MPPTDVIQLIGVSSVALAGLVVVIGVTVRFVFSPVVKARRLAAASAAASSQDTARLDARMDALEEEVRHLGAALDRVAAAAEFDAQLRAGASASALPPKRADSR